MISPMRKLSVFAFADDADFLVNDLMWLSCVEIDKNTQHNDAYLHSLDFSEELSRLEAEKNSLFAALKFLSPYRKTEKKLFAPKRVFTRAEFEGSAEKRKTALSLAYETEKISEEISSLNEKINAEKEYLSSLSVWKTLDVPLGVTGTKKTAVFIGTLPHSAKIPTLSAELSEKTNGESELSLVFEDVSASYIFVVCHRDYENEALSLLNACGFNKMSFKSDAETAVEEEKKTLLEISEDERKQKALVSRAKEICENIPDMEIAADIVNSEISKVSAKSRLSGTEKTVRLTGYIPEKKTAKVEKTLSKYVCAYDISVPEDPDDVPILLSNNRFADPFESLIGLYSYPKYGTFDPTFILGIFYALFFGMMSADVGYGLVIVIGCLLALKFMKPGIGMSRFLKMFAISGVSCIIMGVLFGGWFGDLPKQFAENILGINGFNGPWYLLNPLEDPMTFFVISLALGFIHLCVGMGIKMAELIRNGKIFSAIFDIGSWYVVYAGIAVLALFKIPWVLVIGLLMIVLTHGRDKKNPIMKFFSGLLGLYDIVNFMSDILSYSRILALGLSSAVIASVFNILATLGGRSPISIILFPLVFILGHGLNLLLSLLSSFIHSSRLQYVEFFGKFYEDGGRAFSPVRHELKYVDVDINEDKT